MRSLTRTTWRWLLPTLGLAGLGLLASPGFAATVTFDAGEGLPAAFSEAGITVEPLVGAESHVHLGDNDGDGSSDLMLHALCCSTPYVFTFADGTFTPAKLDFVLDGGVHTLTSSSGASLALDATGTVHLPAVGWSGITSFSWQNDGFSHDDRGIMDNLRFCPGDCDDGNLCTTDGCDPDDASADANGCTHTPNSLPCDDGVFCNGTDTCGEGTCSLHAGYPCVAGAVCADTCSEESRNCLTPDGTSCPDDGNVCTDDLCDGAGACQHAPNVASCEDGNRCTTGDRCADGACTPGRGCDLCLGCDPAIGCVIPPPTDCAPAAPRRASLRLRSGGDGGQSELLWQWASQRPTSKDEFGDPVRAGTEYGVCLYTGGAAHVVTSATHAPACSPATSSCWTENASGFLLAVPRAQAAPVQKIIVRAGANGRGKIRVRAGGPLLHIPTLPLSMPVRVRFFRIDDDRCWEASYSAGASVNDEGEFSAKSD